MLYTIPEASKQVGISKVTGYKWIKESKELKKCLTIRNGIQYLSEDGLVKLRELAEVKAAPNKQEPSKLELDISRALEEFTRIQEQDKQTISKLNQRLDFLEGQLIAKDKQIEQGQIMQYDLQKKEEKILLLEESSKKSVKSLWKSWLNR